MKRSTHIKTISNSKTGAVEVAKEISQGCEPLLIPQDSGMNPVLMDVHCYEKREETLSLLRMLALGHREIEQGQYRSASEVFAELDERDRSAT